MNTLQICSLSFQFMRGNGFPSDYKGFIFYLPWYFKCWNYFHFLHTIGLHLAIDTFRKRMGLPFKFWVFLWLPFINFITNLKPMKNKRTLVNLYKDIVFVTHLSISCTPLFTDNNIKVVIQMHTFLMDPGL